MEFSDDIILQVNFLLTVYNRCKPGTTKKMLADMLNMMIENHIMHEMLKNYLTEENIKNEINKQKVAFKYKFGKVVR